MDKFYFEEDGSEEFCYLLQHFEERIEDGEEEILLRLAKREYGADFMWCKFLGEPIETGVGNCGRICEDYEPRNKISGRCVHLVNCFASTGNTLVLTKDGLGAPMTKLSEIEVMDEKNRP